MENLDFRRDYYMSELEKMYDRIPTDMYYKSEYEQITINIMNLSIRWNN